jgi:hypothetical protein
VKKIWIAEGYPDELSEKMLAEAGVELVVFPHEGQGGDPVPCACSGGCSCTAAEGGEKA